jgi:dTDP-4-amino-4,6-dideoxygalactose transaminase
VANRRELAARYHELLAPLGLRAVRDPSYGESNFQSFWVELGPEYPMGRNELLSALAAEGISARAGIMAAHRQPAYADHPRIDLPVTERLTDHTLILPLFHTMEEADQAAVVGAVRRAAGMQNRLVTRSGSRAATRA